MKHFISICSLLLLFSNSIGQIIPPYYNSFDNQVDTAGWTHYSISGTDDWEMGIPNKPYFSTAYTNPNAWVTNLTANFAASSNRALVTPVFNLSDISTSHVLSFYHKRQTSASGVYFFVEYSINSGANWNLLYNASALSKNWQSATGFSSNYYSTFEFSSIDLSYLNNPDSICFRFRMSNGNSGGAGWLIDNFSIGEEYYDVVAHQADTIKGINKYFSTVTVSSSFIFHNQWNSIYNFSNDFYFSSDSILDGSDILLGTVPRNTSGSSTTWNNTFNLPSDLAAGEYYIFYTLDATDVLAEASETNNTSFAVLYIDSIYTLPYMTDFETVEQVWNNGPEAENSFWKKGDPNSWHIEDPRSGAKCWYSNDIGSTNPSLITPYINLDSSTNTVLSIWYRNSHAYSIINFRLLLPQQGTSTTTYPYFPNTSQYTVLIPGGRHYGWDCYTRDISEYDGEASTKFMFTAWGTSIPLGINQTEIDDVYIGPSRPDVAIEGEKQFLYTISSTTIDTLRYLLYNSGLVTLDTTTTRFYWSTDSVYDAGDVYLGSKNEPQLGDTTFISTRFIYTKPTNLPGEYFIIYFADANNSATEMREYDNSGFFRIEQTFKAGLPYTNDFESDLSGWSHRASLGKDEWVWCTPSKNFIDTCFSGVKAFVTNDTGIVSPMSRMHLLSPVFDLTQLQNPVMEFNMLLNVFINNIVGNPRNNNGNIVYSVDGGSNWIIADTTNQSFKKFYYSQDIDRIDGNDEIDFCYWSELLYGKNLHCFDNQRAYQGRNYEDNYHNVLDLSFLKNYNEVRFMFVYANLDALAAGMTIDDFQIREAEIDLMNPVLPKLMVSHSDELIRANLCIKNNNNYISNPSAVNVSLSETNNPNDNAHFLTSMSIPALMPYQSAFRNLVDSTPSNFGNYHYLRLDIDPGNTNIETDETNNVSFIELSMDTAASFTYPILFDFNDSIMNGWTWYHDSSGFYNGHRFRHMLVENDVIYSGNSGEWFLDPISSTSNYYLWYPIFYIESPSFDFTNKGSIVIDFDFMCIGQSYSGFDKEGGNLQYSIDGGQNWEVLTKSMDVNATNWYEHNQIQSIDDEPGWGYWGSMTHAQFHLPYYLENKSNMRFRFKFRSTRDATISPGCQGFRMDNFAVSTLIWTKENYFGDSIYQIFPNPTTGIVNMDFSQETTCNYTIYNSQGVVVTFGKVSNETNKTIDLSEFSNGIYFLQVQNEEQSFISKIQLIKPD